MIRGLLLALLLALGLAAPAAAQGLTNFQAQLRPQISTTYAGPVDNLGTATVFRSCTEAMSAAYAVSGRTGCVVCLPSDLHCETLSFNTAGQLVLGTFTSACTIPGGGTICTIKTFINQANPGTGDSTQSTISMRFTFSPAAASNGCPSASWACALAPGATDTAYAGTITTVGAPYSIATVLERTANFTTNLIGPCDAGTTLCIYFGSSANKINSNHNGACNENYTAADSTPHTVQSINTATTYSDVIDGSANSGSCSNIATGTAFNVGYSGLPLASTFIYDGLWAAAFTSGQYGAQHTQDNTRFGTP